MFVLVLMTGCKQIEYVPIEIQTHDTVYQSKIERDSVWLHDSILVKEKGDSVFIEKWHTKIREVLKVDTVYRSKSDTVTIPKPYPVEQKPTFTQRMKYYIQAIGFSVFVIVLLLVFQWFFRRRF